MKKTIILSGGIKKNMSFEEVYRQFYGMRADLIRKIKVANYDTIDLLQEIDICMWKAYQNYDGRCNFSTLFTVYANRRLYQIISNQKAIKRKVYDGISSLDYVVSDSDTPTTLNDLIEDKNSNVESSVINKCVIEDIKKKLKPKELDLLHMLNGNITRNEYRARYDISTQNMTNRIARLRKKIITMI